jgi:hypothetical protein
MEEQAFVYLGKILNVRFAVRIIMGGSQSYEENARMSGRVYQSCICSELVEEGENMIIFNVSTDRVFPVRCYHEDMAPVEISLESLALTFKRLLETDRSADREILVVKHDPSSDRYETITINEPEPLQEIKRLIVELSKPEFKMEKFEFDVVTNISMDYLKD